MRKIGFMYLPAGHFVPYRSSRLHYHSWGTGPRILFAFHGYGESAASFDFIGNALDPEFTLIAIDLPFHGYTEWNEGLSFSPEQLYEVMQKIAATSPWRLFGYSMGGRIALQLLENHPDSFDRLILLAPDGLKVNFLYWIATRTSAGNLLFRWTMRRPGWLFFALRLCNALHVVNPSIYKFAVHYIDDRPIRQDLYIRWTAMRQFRPGLGAIAAIIRRRQIPVSLVYGRYDRIIRWETAEKFRNRGIDDLCRLIILDTGHQLLRPQFLNDLLPLLTG
jgi:pimeloyl-ACP methyl ester carboxylesterase